MERPAEGSDPASEVRERWSAGRRDEAYALTVEATKDSLYRYLMSILRDPEAAREVFQETYLRVFRSLGGYRGDATLSTWVLRIGRNLAWNRLRGQRLRESRATSFEDAELPAPAGGEPASRSLLAALEALPPPQREAVVLYYLEEWSVAQVAEATGRPANTVKSDLRRARETLRRALDRPQDPIPADVDKEAG